MTPIRLTNQDFLIALDECWDFEHKHGLRSHDLRHTCAALLISAGAHPKEIAETLGHSSIAITMSGDRCVSSKAVAGSGR